MIKAIIFDCFGVLNVESWRPFKSEYFGNDTDLYAQATKLVNQANTGKISNDEFLSSVAAMTNMSPQQVLSTIRQSRPNAELFTYIDELKALGYKIGLLSNVADNFLSQIFSEGQLNLFDACCLSYQVGSVKPESQIYKVMAEKLKVRPDQAVFIDDQAENAEGAERIGMRALVYENVDKLKADLSLILKAN